MYRKILDRVPEFPESKCFENTKAAVSKLMETVAEGKGIDNDDKVLYTDILKEISWGMTKVVPRWPIEVERIMEEFKKAVQDFQLSLAQPKKFTLCGSNRQKSPKQLFRKIMSYQYIFPLIGHYQDKNLRQQLVDDVIKAYEQVNPRPTQMPQSVVTIEKVRQAPKIVHDSPRQEGKCRYCDLYLSLSLLPNGSLAKKLLDTLPNVQWIKGVQYEEGKLYPEDISMAIEMYKRGAAKGSAEALYKLGSLNEQGVYGQPNEYIKMWTKAAQMGSLEAITDMGYLFEKGVFNEETGQMIMRPDSDKAHQYYLRAANAEFPRGLNNLGSFYQLDAKYKNPDLSLKFFNKAIEAGYVKAMFNLGLCYSKGFLKTNDRDKAVNLFKRAAQLGDHYSKLFYVDMLLNGDTSNCTEDQLYEVNKFCRQMIAQEEERPEAYYFLGVTHEAGLGAPQEPKTAQLYYLKAAKLNYPHAIVKLGDCYRTGFGVQQDYREALRYYQQVADKRPDVLVSMGLMYEQGSAELRRDYQKAFDYYFDACNKNVVQAFNKLGAMYRNGYHVRKDDTKANEYFRRGAMLAQQNSLSASRTSLMPSESDMIQSNFPKKVSTRR